MIYFNGENDSGTEQAFFNRFREQMKDDISKTVPNEIFFIK